MTEKNEFHPCLQCQINRACPGPDQFNCLRAAGILVEGVEEQAIPTTAVTTEKVRQIQPGLYRWQARAGKQCAETHLLHGCEQPLPTSPR